MNQKALSLQNTSSFQLVLTLGHNILRSREFTRGLNQVHHLGTSVSKHSFRVAVTAVELAKLLNRYHINVDLSSLVRGSLMHDFGILGRYEGKFKGVKRCCLLQHPKDSLTVAGNLCSDLTEIEANMIASHMWPCAFTAPHTKEAWLINIADKIVGTKECFEGMTMIALFRKKAAAVC